MILNDVAMDELGSQHGQKELDALGTELQSRLSQSNG